MFVPTYTKIRQFASAKNIFGLRRTLSTSDDVHVQNFYHFYGNLKKRIVKKLTKDQKGNIKL